jgi:signal transduction histidine kinase
LLTFSRNQPATTEVIDVNAVVARTAGVLKGMLGDDIGVTLALDGDIKRIKAGASHVEEIVLNLALHARDAMPNGGRLTFTTAMHTATERMRRWSRRARVRLITADTGCGISKENQATVFEPFLTTRGSVGSAIGLAKVYDIVKQSGGHIHLDSAAGVGTTFTVDLPATGERSVEFDARRRLDWRWAQRFSSSRTAPRARAGQGDARSCRTRGGGCRGTARSHRRAEEAE